MGSVGLRLHKRPEVGDENAAPWEKYSWQWNGAKSGSTEHSRHEQFGAVGSQQSGRCVVSSSDPLGWRRSVAYACVRYEEAAKILFAVELSGRFLIWGPIHWVASLRATAELACCNIAKLPSDSSREPCGPPHDCDAMENHCSQPIPWLPTHNPPISTRDDDRPIALCLIVSICGSGIPLIGAEGRLSRRGWRSDVAVCLVGAVWFPAACLVGPARCCRQVACDKVPRKGCEERPRPGEWEGERGEKPHRRPPSQAHANAARLVPIRHTSP
jgi:hypothetical protein